MGIKDEDFDSNEDTSKKNSTRKRDDDDDVKSLFPT